MICITIYFQFYECLNMLNCEYKGRRKRCIRTFCEKVLDSYQKFSIQLVNTKQVKMDKYF